ncbi:HU family DNA-binding protein [bacterium]|nr:HU family DNA-binding protein [bacterium]
MNKAELTDVIAKEAKVTKAQAKRAIESFTGNIQKSLKKNKEVRLIGFGTFGVRKRKARKGVNPQTGATIKIAAKKVPFFRPGSELKRTIAGK